MLGLILFAYLFTIFLLIKYCRDSYRIRKTIDILKGKNPVSKKLKEYPFILVNIPVYKEQKIIRETFEHFAKFNYPKDKLQINIISTEREGRGLGTTFEEIKKCLRDFHKKSNVNFKHIHYPFKKGNKAHQLNYAIKNTKLPSLGKIYFGVYDADSRPDFNSLIHLANEANQKGYPDVFQQFSLYFKNYSSSSSFSKAIAMFQSRWTLIYELLACRENLELKRMKNLLYSIGHGIFLSKSTYDETRGFPEDTFIEDLALGYRVSFLGKKIHPIYSFDLCDVPVSLGELVKQNSGWYAGEQYILRNRDFVKKQVGRTVEMKKFFVPFLFRKMSVLMWGLGSFVFLLTLTLNLIFGNYLPSFVLFLSGYVYSIRGVGKIIKSRYILENKCSSEIPIDNNTLSFYLWMPIRSLINSFGPIRYYIKNIFFILKKIVL